MFHFFEGGPHYGEGKLDSARKKKTQPSAVCRINFPHMAGDITRLFNEIFNEGKYNLQ